MQVTIARQLGLEPTTVGNFFMNARRRSMDKWKDEDPKATTLLHQQMSPGMDGDDQDQDGDLDNDVDDQDDVLWHAFRDRHLLMLWTLLSESMATNSFIILLAEVFTAERWHLVLLNWAACSCPGPIRGDRWYRTLRKPAEPRRNVISKKPILHSKF